METVGGYKIIRRLGAGARAEVFLGHPGSDPAASLVAIKMFRSGVDQRSIDDEVGVLARMSSPHLLGLVDLATAPDGRPCLVLPRLGGASLARLLAERVTIEPGEAVTILTPLCEAVAALHETRSCHGAIRPASVLFDRSGAPVLACFGSGSTFGIDGTAPASPRVTAAELMAESGVAGDLERLGAVAGVVLTRAFQGEGSGSGPELLDWLRSVDPGSETQGFARELGARIFELAQAIPVEFGRPADAVAQVSARGTVALVSSGDRHVPIVPAASDAPPDTTPAPARTPAPTVEIVHRMIRLVRRRVAHVLPGWQPHTPLATTAVTRVSAAFGSVRKPFKVAAIVGASALVLAIVLMMPSMARTDAAQGPAPATVGSSGQTRQARGTPAPTTTPAAEGSGQTEDDDPVAAAEALLRSRELCIRKLSVLCLDEVDQQGSSAMEDDSYLIRSLQQGGMAVEPEQLAEAKASLSERLGDSALIVLETGETGDTASILLVKGQPGWRIRDFLPR